jgi:hypothetical protein
VPGAKYRDPRNSKESPATVDKASSVEKVVKSEVAKFESNQHEGIVVSKEDIKRIEANIKLLNERCTLLKDLYVPLYLKEAPSDMMTVEGFENYQKGLYARVERLKEWADEEDLTYNLESFITDSLFGSAEKRKSLASRLYALYKEYKEGLLVVAEISLIRARELHSTIPEEAIDTPAKELPPKAGKPGKAIHLSYSPDQSHQEHYHRKYWKTNLTNSEYFGLLMSRMYTGS